MYNMNGPENPWDWYIFAYIYHQNQQNIDIPYMDPMGIYIYIYILYTYDCSNCHAAPQGGGVALAVTKKA